MSVDASDAVLSFGLIWLDYLRRREPTLAVAGLVLFLPSAFEKNACLRLAFLDKTAATYLPFLYTGDGLDYEIDLQDYGNLDTKIEPCRGESPSRQNRFSAHNPELWLESKVRADIQQIDATLRREPVYDQVPAFAGRNRGIIDLLAVDHHGRLAVLELKATEDIHLPLQALDYWMRVVWHLRRGEFAKNGYFPGIELRSEPPRILLISPALDVHPTNERILRYLSPAIEIDRIGVGADWRDTLRVMFRMSSPWH